MSAVANTILRQLGGMGFVAMTGARCASDDRSLIVQLPRSFLVVIELAPGDTYTLRYGKRMTARQQIERDAPEVLWLTERRGVYWSALATVFTRVTGLETRL